MSFPAPLSASPVASTFPVISTMNFGRKDPLEKLNLSPPEKATLRKAEANPLDYTLGDLDEAVSYVTILLKVLSQSTGPKDPSSRVSKLVEPLSDDEAMEIMNMDARGVLTHYAITKLYEVILCLREKNGRSRITIASVFYDDNGAPRADFCNQLFSVLHLGKSGDAFAQRGSAACLAFILMAACPSKQQEKTRKQLEFSKVEEPVRALVSWMASELQSFASTSVWTVIPALVTIVECSHARIMFAESGGIAYLSRYLRQGQKVPRNGSDTTGSSAQQVYELCYCLWTMTYECNANPFVCAHFARDGAVAALVDLFGGAPREKVVRVALAALRNLATVTPTDSIPDSSTKKVVDGAFFLNEMIGCGLIKSVDLMEGRQWTDPDIVEDLDTLYKLLHENYKEMSRWDVYKAEVESGHLAWGVAHTEKFFKANARKFEGPDSNFELVKLLIRLVLSDDDEVVPVACFDLGEFVRHYPNGRSIAKRLGAKDVVMKMIEHENDEVQRHALQCVSKMMVQNWTAVH